MTQSFCVHDVPAITRKNEGVARTVKKFGIKCSQCNELWMVGDRERTEEEKKEWMCPNCKEALALDSKAEEEKDDKFFGKRD